MSFIPLLPLFITGTSITASASALYYYMYGGEEIPVAPKLENSIVQAIEKGVNLRHVETKENISNRELLMQSIREKKSLRKNVEINPIVVKTNDEWLQAAIRGLKKSNDLKNETLNGKPPMNLLQEIQKGIELKPARQYSSSHTVEMLNDIVKSYTVEMLNNIVKSKEFNDTRLYILNRFNSR